LRYGISAAKAQVRLGKSSRVVVEGLEGVLRLGAVHARGNQDEVAPPRFRRHDEI
jgi:hypothetical protein